MTSINITVAIVGCISVARTRSSEAGSQELDMSVSVAGRLLSMAPMLFHGNPVLRASDTAAELP